MARPHAPWGELKERSAARAGDRRAALEARELPEKTRRSPPPSASTSTSPSASPVAASTESASCRAGPASSPAGRRRRRCRACTSCRARSSRRGAAARHRPSPARTPGRGSRRGACRPRPCAPWTTGAMTMNRDLPQRHQAVDDLLHRLTEIGAPHTWCSASRSAPTAAAGSRRSRSRADRRAWVARRGLLVDRDRRRQPLDRVDVGLLHLAEELAGRTRTATRRSGAGPRRRSCRRRGSTSSTISTAPCDDDQRVTGQRQVDALEVVRAGAGDDNLARSRDENKCTCGFRCNFVARSSFLVPRATRDEPQLPSPR